jgi:cytochrome c oxidase subunit 1
VARKGSRLAGLLRTTDHKTIGLMYLTTSFLWFVVGQDPPPGSRR